MKDFFWTSASSPAIYPRVAMLLVSLAYALTSPTQTSASDGLSLSVGTSSSNSRSSEDGWLDDRLETLAGVAFRAKYPTIYAQFCSVWMRP